MKGPLALALLAAALAAPACAGTEADSASRVTITPVTKLTIRTWLTGGRPGVTYTLTCGPARITGLPAGRLRPLDACRALALIGDRIYRPTLSLPRVGCAYVQAPPRAEIVGQRRGRTVRTAVSVGPCERLLVARATLDRVVAWDAADR